jgi:hypothetical protein
MYEYEPKFGTCFRCGNYDEISTNNDLCADCLKELNQTECEYSNDCWRFSILMAIPCHHESKDEFGRECGKHRELRERKEYTKLHGF